MSKEQTLVGKTVKAVVRTRDWLTITFEDGTELSVGLGDSGGTFSPEPYFSVEVLPPGACKAPSFLGRCHEVDCKFHRPLKVTKDEQGRIHVERADKKDDEAE